MITLLCPDAYLPPALLPSCLQKAAVREGVIVRKATPYKRLSKPLGPFWVVPKNKGSDRDIDLLRSTRAATDAASPM